VSATPATATAERRAVRRHPYFGDQPVDTSLLDAVEAQKAGLAAAEADAIERDKIDAAKLAAAKEVLASGKVEALAEAQAQVEKLIDSYIEWTEHAHAFRAEVTEARDVVAFLGGDTAPIPPTLALRASVGSDYELRVKLDRFRRLSIAGGEA
jgi:hypothetical protein